MRGTGHLDKLYHRSSNSSSGRSSNSDSGSSDGSSGNNNKGGVVCEYWARLTLDSAPFDGAPAEAWMQYTLRPSSSSSPSPSSSSLDVAMSLVIAGKVPRFNEAAFLLFGTAPPPLPAPSSAPSPAVVPPACDYWSMSKLGHTVGFDEVIQGGSATVHAADTVSCRSTRVGGVDRVGHVEEGGSQGDSGEKREGGERGEKVDMLITSLDAPVVSPFNASRPPTVLLNNQEDRFTAEDVTGAAFNLVRTTLVQCNKSIFSVATHMYTESLAYDILHRNAET